MNENDLPADAAKIKRADSASVYAEHLSRMIQCRTVTIESGGEPVAFDQLHAVLRECYPLVFSRLESFDVAGHSLLLRWAGADSERDPVVLLAHQDVVEAEGPWQYPPFEGQIREGMVWGRGAIDNKGCLCAIFEAVESLLAENVVPQSDVYLALSHNEEQMGDGAPSIVRWFSDHDLCPSFVLDEGGAIIDSVLPTVKGLTAMVGTAEKGYLTVRFCARSQGGHASTPPRSSPLGRLSQLINRIERHSPFPARLNPVCRAMFRSLAPAMSGIYRILFGWQWLTGPILPGLLKAIGGEGRALVMTTCAFTMAQGSRSPNVLPETAFVTANLRIAIHQSVDAVMAVLKKQAAALGLECDVLYAHEPTAISSLSAPAAYSLLNSIRTIFPSVNIAPYTMLAASDAHHFCAICDHVYRFTPLVLSRAQRAGIHGLDEGLPVDQLVEAAAFYRTLLTS